jgi:hypothetical protein
MASYDHDAVVPSPIPVAAITTAHAAADRLTRTPQADDEPAHAPSSPALPTTHDDNDAAAVPNPTPTAATISADNNKNTITTTATTATTSTAALSNQELTQAMTEMRSQLGSMMNILRGVFAEKKS